MTSVRPAERRPEPGALEDGATARPIVPVITGAIALLVAATGVLLVGGGASFALLARTLAGGVVVLAVAAVLGAVLVAHRLAMDDPRRSRILDAGAVAASAWAVAAATTAFLLYLVDAPATSSPAFGPGLVAFVADVPAGRSWVVAAASAAVLSALLVGVRSRGGVALLGPAAVAALLPIALQVPPPGTPLAAARVLAGVALVQLVALGSWLGAVATAAGAGTSSVLPGRGRPVRAQLLAAGAASIVTACGWWQLIGAGMVTPIAIAGGVLIVVAALVGLRSRAVGAMVLAAGLGLGVAASVTRSTPSVAARSTPAEILTGAPLPAPLSPATALGAWLPDPVWTVAALALLIAYAAGVARRGRPWPAARTTAWVVGLVLLVWLTGGAPAVYAPLLFGVQLAQQLALLLLVPVLLAFGAPLQLLRGPRPTRLPGAPVAALVLVVVAAAMRSAGVLRWSVADPLGTELIAALALLTGLLFASSVRRASLRTALVVTGALLLLETVAAVLLALSPSLVLADWFGAMGWGTDAIAAQRSAALPAWLIAAGPTVAVAVGAVRASRGSAPVVTA